MKYLKIAIALSVLLAYTCDVAAANATGSTVVCESCPTTSSTSRFVTRASVPTTPCSAPALTVILNPSSVSAGNSTKPTTVPFTGAGAKIAGSMSGALAMALVAVYVL